MNSKQAKALRRALLPSPRKEVQASRGTVMRTLAELEEDGKVVHSYPWPLQQLFGPIRVESPMRVINKPGTPRATYRQLKKDIKRERG